MPNTTPIEVGDVVIVPFSHIDTPRRQKRPSLVLRITPEPALDTIVWVAMITHAENAPWLDDIAIADLRGTGLVLRSVVRPLKLAAYEALEVRPIGRVDPVTLGRALDFLAYGRR